MVNISQVLTLLVDVEVAMAELYAWYAHLFCDNPAAVSFFTRLEQDEYSHRDQVRFQVNLVSKNRSLYADVDIGLQELRAAIAAVEAHRSGPPPTSLSEAVAFALTMERSAVEQHYRTATVQANPEMAQFLKALTSGDRFHVDAIETFARDLGVS